MQNPTPDNIRLLRFADLKARKIVSNRVTLGRWIESLNFPPGFLIGENSRAWRESDIERWLAEREAKQPEVAEAQGNSAAPAS